MARATTKQPTKAAKETILPAGPIRRLRTLMDQLDSEAELVKSGALPLDKARVLATYRRHEIRLIEVTVSAARLSDSIRKTMLRAE